YVKAAADSLENSGLKCTLNPMGTTVEAENAEEIFAALANAREAVFEMGSDRVYMVLKMDERRDKDRKAEDMTRSVRDD
ncbi:MAG: MTH1187 family thiamine-binding protein, partial [Rubrobacteraceae bacterium]